LLAEKDTRVAVLTQKLNELGIPIIPSECLKVIRILGEGATGVVVLADYIDENDEISQVAIKRVKNTTAAASTVRSRPRLRQSLQ